MTSRKPLSHQSFIQSGPAVENTFDTDPALEMALRLQLPSAIYAAIQPGLQQLGERAATDLLEAATQAETQQPTLEQYDEWGNRIDKINTSTGWETQRIAAATEGIVATGYAQVEAEWSRVHGFARLYLYHPSSAYFSCPLAMTDGAAKLLQVYGISEEHDAAFSRLVSFDPNNAWTSGQWMTERSGGSDVGNSETIAVAQPNGTFKLYGDKWFTSAITSDMAMTLARIQAPNGKTVAGSKGLSVFYLRIRNDDGALNGIVVNRLKDKLGTKALPTAELTLDGTVAELIGDPGKGVRTISTLFNVTRIYNAVCATSGFRRGLMLARDYAHQREAFGHPLRELPLHTETLAKLEVDCFGSQLLIMHLAHLLGKEETGVATDEDTAELRLLTPVCKLYTAKLGVAGLSEIVESFGGAGYIENTGIPRLLRDEQVLAIWEGTTNVLALDTLRALAKEQAFTPFVEACRAKLEAAGDLHSYANDVIADSLMVLGMHARRMMAENQALVEAGARVFAYGIARTAIAALMLQNYQRAMERGTQRDQDYSRVALDRWLSTPLIKPNYLNQQWLQDSHTLVYGPADTTK